MSYDLAAGLEAIPTRGIADDRWAPLADVLGRMVGAQGGGGAALAVYHDGVPVVDLVAGDYADDTVQQLYSVSKAVTAVALAMAHDEGLIDLDAPLSTYWPAFGKASTAAVTVRSVLSHRSGLSALVTPLTFDDLVAGRDEAAVEVLEPHWEPGTGHGYHAFTFGTLVNGALARATGASVGEFVDRRIARPLDLSLWIGTPEDQLHRVRPMLFPPLTSTAQQAAHEASRAPDEAVIALVGDRANVNTPEFLRASFPSGTGVAGARDLARFLAATLGPVDGVRLLSEGALTAMTATRSRGLDRTLGVVSHFGSGVQRPFPQLPMLGAESFGHEAAGGTVAVADPELGLAIGVTTNVFPSAQGASVGAMSLLNSVRHCLVTDPHTV